MQYFVMLLYECQRDKRLNLYLYLQTNEDVSSRWCIGIVAGKFRPDNERTVNAT